MNKTINFELLNLARQRVPEYRSIYLLLVCLFTSLDSHILIPRQRICTNFSFIPIKRTSQLYIFKCLLYIIFLYRQNYYTRINLLPLLFSPYIDLFMNIYIY